MSKEIENTEAIDNNGDSDYGEFLKEMSESGVVADGDKIYKEGIGLIQPPEVKHTNAAIIASVPNASAIYDKNDKTKGVVLDLMARTNFRSHEELIYFLDWLEWCEDFGTGYDGPMRYCVAINSEGGLARQQYVDAITTTRFSNTGGIHGNKQNQFRPKYKEGELS